MVDDLNLQQTCNKLATDAQPKQKNEFNTLDALDSISRQAAIDAVGANTWAGSRIRKLPSAQPESYKEKLKEIADALSEKFAYMNTCLNERDIILGYLGVKRPNKIHCNTDCTNTKCESHPLSSAQQERKKGRWLLCGNHHLCSECDEWALTRWDEDECDEVDILTNYCPNCGADMRGEQDG